MAFQDLTLFSGGGGGSGSGSGSGSVRKGLDIEIAEGTLNGDETGKTPRLPRWTRQEILVLIQGKRVAENRVRRGRTSGLAYGSGQPEPKWASVSSYCRKHGVNRGPIQCRKRWSNLAGDFKKIKEWESGVKEESYWIMRNDLRRERKLPGFFDKEVYDILDGVVPIPLNEDAGLALSLTRLEPDDEKEKVKEEKEVVFDSGRSAAAEDGLFSDFDFDQSGGGQDQQLLESAAADTPSEVPAPIPISEKEYHPFTGEGADHQGVTSQQQTAAGGRDPEIGSTSNHDKKKNVDPEIGSTSNHENKKRKRLATETEEAAREQAGEGDDRETNITSLLQDQLIEVLQRNGRILGSHLENQNTSLKLDREERKSYANSLVSVLDKLADALGKIADKL